MLLRSYVCLFFAGIAVSYNIGVEVELVGVSGDLIVSVWCPVTAGSEFLLSPRNLGRTFSAGRVFAQTGLVNLSGGNWARDFLAPDVSVDVGTGACPLPSTALHNARRTHVKGWSTPAFESQPANRTTPTIMDAVNPLPSSTPSSSPPSPPPSLFLPPSRLPRRCIATHRECCHPTPRDNATLRPHSSRAHKRVPS